MNLEELSRAELVRLRADVDKALETLEARRLETARAAVAAAAKEHGFDLAQLLNAPGKGKAKGQKNPPKYRNPANGDQTWTGRGRKPAWIKEALDAGQSIESLEI